MNGFWVFGWGALSVYYRCIEVCEPNSVATWHVTPLFSDGQWIFRYGFGNTFFLLLHHVRCPRGSVLKGWHLDRGGTSDRIRFIYACQPVMMPAARRCNAKPMPSPMHRRGTRWLSIFRGRMWSLLFHSPACKPSDGYKYGQAIRGFNLRLRYSHRHRHQGGWRQQFRYICQDLEPKQAIQQVAEVP